MRKIKFRAWDRNHGKMVFPNEQCTTGTLIDWFEDEDLMQYTSLKDKNGREIYERDIIEYELQLIPIRKTEIYEVTWWQSGFGFKRPGEEDGCATYLQLSKVAVIGNVHENPELMQK